MLFKQIVGQSETERNPGPTDDFWYGSLGHASASGLNVSPESAMRASAVYACVKVVSETIASLPIEVHEKLPSGFSKKAPDHPLQELLGVSPTPRMTSFEWFEMQIAFGALYGNAYAIIKDGRIGPIGNLEPIRPDRVRVFETESGRLVFEVSNPHTGVRTRYTEDEIFRVPGFTFNGVEGIAPIAFARDPVGLALATEQFGSRYFSQDATPSGVLKHPNNISDEALKNLKASWKKRHTGLANSHSIAILEEGMEFQPIATANRDSQFLETRKYQISEIARFFRIPLHMINELEKSSFNNIEQQSIEFVKYTIRPWVTRIEQRINKDLIINNRRFFVRFNLDGLLRGERKARFEGHGIAIDKGFMTRNEVRELEGLPPKDGLDDVLTPLNMDSGNNTVETQPEPATDEASVAVADAILDDIAFRTTSAELKGIQVAISKAKENNDLEARIQAFYEDKHRAYIRNCMRPYASVLQITLLDDNYDVAGFASYYTREAINAIVDSDDLEALIQEWDKNRAEEFKLSAKEYASEDDEL